MGLTTKEISSSSFNDMISSVDRRSEYVENRAGANVRLNNFLTPYTLDDKSSILNAPCGYSNGVYPSLRPVKTFGTELIDLTQGTAEEPSQWSNITTNSVNFLPGAAGIRYFNIDSTQGTLISGRKYSLTLQISNYSGSQTLGISTAGNISSDARLDFNGIYKEVFVSNGGTLRIFGRSTNSATITVSVKEVTEADFDFTRGTTATRVNEQGLIEDVQILSGELVQNGDFATDSDWAKGTGWTISGGTASCDGSQSGNSNFSQSNVINDQSKTYRVEFTLSNYATGSVKAKFGNAAQGVNRTANGTYVDILSGMSNNQLTFTASSDFVGSIDNVSVKEVTDDTDLPRIDYTGGTGSLLLEPQSTNLLTYSEDFSQSYWNKSQISVDDDFTISPDGTQNASKITINSSIPFLGNTTISLTTGSVYTISCFVKKGTNRWVRLSSVSSGTLGAWFDLDNNVVGTVNSTSASIENYGNGWYKISNTLTAISGSNQTFLGLSDADGGTTSTQIGNTVFAWGFQVEELSYATSYIPTSGSTVTRNADACRNSGSSDLINSTEGVLYVEAFLKDTGTFKTAARITATDTSTNDGLWIYFRSDNKIQGVLRVGGIDQTSVISSVQTTNEYYKVAFKFKQNDFSLFVNGIEVATDPNGNTFSADTLSKLGFKLSADTNPFIGNVRSVAVFKEALTDEELAKITSTTQQEVFYEMRDRMLQINADYYEFGDYTTRLKKLF